MWKTELSLMVCLAVLLVGFNVVVRKYDNKPQLIKAALELQAVRKQHVKPFCITKR